jgi:hypothetical protein
MADSQSRFAELAFVIHSRTEEIDIYLKTHGLPSPSFEIDSAPDLPLPASLAKAREEILEACTELRALASGPLGHLTRLTSPTGSGTSLKCKSLLTNSQQMNVLVGLQAIYRYKIASSFKLEEEVTFEEIAKRCGITEPDCRQLLRVAIANHIFHEPQKGIVSHSAISKLLTNPAINEWNGMVCEDMWPIADRTLDAMEKWPGSQEPNQTAAALSNADGLGIFESLATDPIKRDRFINGMKFMQSAPVLDPAHLLNDLQWDDGDWPALMVDIGGSHGSICIELLRKYPNLKCIVEDLPEVVQTAITPPDADGRLEFLPHDFFTEQPVKDADVYFLRWILHDWSDKYAIKILRSLIPALKDGARIIVNEVCLPDPNVLPFYHAQLIR